jgi:hypothetical protein
MMESATIALVDRAQELRNGPAVRQSGLGE